MIRLRYGHTYVRARIILDGFRDGREARRKVREKCVYPEINDRRNNYRSGKRKIENA